MFEAMQKLQARAHAWLDDQAHTLKHATDGVRQVLKALRQLPVQLAGDPTAAAEARDRTVTYFTKRLAQVQYATFQAAGYPIGSAAPKAPTRSCSRRDLRAAGRTGRVLTSIRWWRCGPSRVPIAGQRPGRASAHDFGLRLSSRAARGGASAIRRVFQHRSKSYHHQQLSAWLSLPHLLRHRHSGGSQSSTADRRFSILEALRLRPPP